MSRRYDSKTTTFTPDGRLMQVEYAIEAINKAGSSVGLITSEGIVLATQRMETSALLEDNRQSEKIYTIDQHLYVVVSGMTADANYLIDYARYIYITYIHNNNNNINNINININI